jgi:Phosphatidylinositol-4-phosphate 5-Kinase
LNDPDHLSEFDSEYITKDKKYLIKIVDSDHLQKINSIAAKYVERASDRNSYLIVLYGIFSIEYKDSSTINFLVFENLECDEDLRIATLAGEEKDQTSNIIKINHSDVIQQEDRVSIKLSRNMLTKVKNTIKLDTKVLANYKFLEYSLKLLYPLRDSKEHKNPKKIIEYSNSKGYLVLYYKIKDYRSSISNSQNYRQKFIDEIDSLFILE